MNPPRCFIGFDGFTDEILTAVKERHDADTFTPFPTISSFGDQILAAKDQSGNIELVTKQIKLGGNAPIMANALLELGFPITLVATIGNQNAIESLFRTLTDRCETTIPLGPSSYSEAIEFQDGKIILGKHQPLLHLNYKHILQTIGRQELINYLDRSALFVSTNWTMIPRMTEIWKNIQIDILPYLSSDKRWMFIDLADPAKRSDENLKEALDVLKQFNKTYKVILGLNIAEAARLGNILKLSQSKDLELLAKDIQKSMEIDQVVIHHKHLASAADNQRVYTQKSFYMEKPVLSTGAGDNFNAGYCAGLLKGFDIQMCLLYAVGVSGYYIRYGKSPNQADLASFIKSNAKGF